MRVLQAAGQGAQVDPTGHAVRMDALHLIREAANSPTCSSATRSARPRRSWGAPSKRCGTGRPTSGSGRARSRGSGRRASASAQRSSTRRVTTPASSSPMRTPGDAGAARSRGPRGAASRAVASPGDGAHERRPGRARADARVGPRAGPRDHVARSAGRGAAARSCGSRRRGSLRRLRRDRPGGEPRGRSSPDLRTCRHGPSPSPRRPSRRPKSLLPPRRTTSQSRRGMAQPPVSLFA